MAASQSQRVRQALARASAVLTSEVGADEDEAADMLVSGQLVNDATKCYDPEPVMGKAEIGLTAGSGTRQMGAEAIPKDRNKKAHSG